MRIGKLLKLVVINTEEIRQMKALLSLGSLFHAKLLNLEE